MPRQAREKAGSRVYHVILRGVNSQQIFECNDDYIRFVTTLRRHTEPYKDGETGCEEPTHFVVFAYCLMSNHVHLLVMEGSEDIGTTMKRIASSYVRYYNGKYNRIGHLFQERFKSQPVENIDYFVTLLRYIHQNPLKPYLVANLADYPWSSWREYIGAEKTPFCKTEVVLRRIALADLRALIEKPMTDAEEDGLMDIEDKPNRHFFTDDDVCRLIQEYSGARNSSEFQDLPRPQQKHYLYQLHDLGIGPRALSRLTGVSYSIVQRATSAANDHKFYPHIESESESFVSEPIQPYGDECVEKFPEY